MTLTNVIVGGAGPVCKRIRSTRQGFPEGIKRAWQTPFRVLLLAVQTSARVQGETRRRLSYNAAMPSERDKSSENPYKASSVEGPQREPRGKQSKFRTLAASLGLVLHVERTVTAIVPTSQSDH